MFAGVIDCRPWGASGLTSALWLDVPSRLVHIADLTLTQPGVLFAPLIEPGTPVGGDHLPHVIDYGGRLYLEDGHHRVMRAALLGELHVEARVLCVSA